MYYVSTAGNPLFVAGPAEARPDAQTRLREAARPGERETYSRRTGFSLADEYASWFSVYCT